MHERTTWTMHQEIRRAGYDQEEEYFYQENQKAIEALRRLRGGKGQDEPKLSAMPRVSGSAHGFMKKVVDFIFRPRPSGIGQFPI